MIDLAVISGTGFYDFPSLEKGEVKEIKTRFGKVSVKTGTLLGRKIIHLARHGKHHKILPNMINYRANILALKALETKAIIGTTVCGVLDPDISLGKLVVFSDLYFPENRLPGGELCTVYERAGDKRRGHYMFSSPFSESLRSLIIGATKEAITDAVYAHVNGPRFNSKSEISMLRTHASFISQTAGPEIVLAGELEIPYALLGFGVDYGNGIKDVPTPLEVLEKNIKKSKNVFFSVVERAIKHYKKPEFDGFVYRFE